MHSLILGFPFALILFAPWVVPVMRPLRVAEEKD